MHKTLTVRVKGPERAYNFFKVNGSAVLLFPKKKEKGYHTIEIDDSEENRKVLKANIASYEIVGEDGKTGKAKSEIAGFMDAAIAKMDGEQP
jgi:hypothetical protein